MKKQEKRLFKDIAYSRISTLFLMILDIIAFNASHYLALWLRFDCQASEITPEFYRTFIDFIPYYTVMGIIVFAVCKMYRCIWSYAGLDVFFQAILSSLILFAVQMVGTALFFVGMPITYYVFGSIIQFAFVIATRFSSRIINSILYYINKKSQETKRVMVIGAGSAGRMIIQDSKRAKELNLEVCCVIDDDSKKWNRLIEGVPVVGGRDAIVYSAKKYMIDEIYVAIPSSSAKDKSDILAICSETDCSLKSLPGLYQIISGEVSVGSMKEVSVEDLLGRDPIKTNLQEVFDFISGKTILVTGGGGSIGSELCRQIAAHNPRQLIIFDIYENNAYKIQLELREKFPDLNLVTLIGSVRDSRRITDVFKKYRPDVVYHAAAHKHVPLMEDSPCEAIKNNAIGTCKTAYAAMLYGCKRFVLISTDKAVNPTNIMGASKRLCEMIIQSFDQKIKEGKSDEIPSMFMHLENECTASDQKPILPDNISTEFVAVRFGNVLGSNGSVVPIFKEQIEKGGPVTVTHPDIIRFFMTIPEAVSLVLQAGIYAWGGEIFVLDMGNPVKIDTLARNLIRMSGFKPDVDIKIEYVGLRPGEKLYEEKLMAEEGMKKTSNELIFIGKPISFDTDVFLKQLEELMICAYENDDRMVEQVAKIVTTYHPAGRLNEQTA